jgi:hypothetical protein
MNDLELLALEAETIFVLTKSGRILRRNSPDVRPDQAAGPRLRLAGCGSGNLLPLRDDVRLETASAIEAFVADEPALALQDSTPVHMDDYVVLLGTDQPIQHSDLGLLWVFPHRLVFAHPARLVTSDTHEGDELLARLTEQGMPDYLVAAGFVDVGEFWAPWCVAFEGDQIASIAFAAGLGPKSAEVGVYTFPVFRGGGYAAASTAGWASLPALRGQALFYGTSQTNASSRRVTQRLGLRFLGATLTIS